MALPSLPINCIKIHSQKLYDINSAKLCVVEELEAAKAAMVAKKATEVQPINNDIYIFLGWVIKIVIFNDVVQKCYYRK